MLKKYIISIEEKQCYPFDGPKHPFQLVAVRVPYIPRPGEHFTDLQQRFNRLIRIRSPFLIALHRVREVRGASLQIDYEYVPSSLAKTQKAYDHNFLQPLREKLLQCLASLAEAGVRIDLRMENIGVGEEGEPKVFVGLNFEVVQQNQRKALGLEYQAALDRMLEGHFGFRNSLHPHSDTQLSQHSQRVDKRLIQMQGKLNKLKLRSPHSCRDSSSDRRGKQPNIVLQAVSSRDSNNSSFTAGTSYSLIATNSRPKVHKSSFGDYSTSSYRLNQESIREDSLQKRVNHALEKTQEAFKIYEKYSRRKRRI